MEMQNINHDFNKSNTFKECLKTVKNKIYKKYYSSNLENKLNKLIINNILRNGKCHIVALFKDFLLYYDYGEFLKRYYKDYEIKAKLVKILNYFNEALIFYPNYSPLIESKYIYNNIIKKQMVINKIEKFKKKNIKNHYKAKIKEDFDEKEKLFFNSTIYGDIFNESESFMSLLFGVESKNKKSEIKKNDLIENENEKEIEDFIKKIDYIQSKNIQNKKIENLITNNNNEHNELNKENNYKKPYIADIPLSASCRFIQKKKYIYNKNNKNNNNSNSVFLKSGNNSIINQIKCQKYIMDNYNKDKINNFINTSENKIQINNINNNSNNNAASKENINNNNNLDFIEKPQDKIVYHRKVKSTIIGNYSNKLDLPSNLNVVNSLKLVNETFGENSQNKKYIKVSLYKKVKNINKNNNSKNSMNKIIKVPKKVNTNVASAKNIKNNKTVMLKTPRGKKKEKGNVIIKLTKVQNNAKEIEIPLVSKKPLYYLVQKRKSPIYTRNHISAISFNNSNGEINNNNNTISINLINSYRKPESQIKSIYINSNMTGPYSKPKGLCREKKYIGMSPKKLFNKSCIEEKDMDKF